MSPLDDPTLALIARFVVDDIEELSVSDEKFLRHQLIEIQNHIEDAPVEQRQQMVMDWIREHAENYRSDWQKKTITDSLLKKRCRDCPLVHGGKGTHCDIHQRWLVLLNDYLKGKLETTEYVDQTLELLQQHKDELKVSRISAQI
jgi:hypothetical protein